MWPVAPKTIHTFCFAGLESLGGLQDAGSRSLEADVSCGGDAVLMFRRGTGVAFKDYNIASEKVRNSRNNNYCK